MESYNADIACEVLLHDGMDAEVALSQDDFAIGGSNGFYCQDCETWIHRFNDWDLACEAADKDEDRPEPIFHWLKQRGMLKRE